MTRGKAEAKHGRRRRESGGLRVPADEVPREVTADVTADAAQVAVPSAPAESMESDAQPDDKHAGNGVPMGAERMDTDSVDVTFDTSAMPHVPTAADVDRAGTVALSDEDLESIDLESAEDESPVAKPMEAEESGEVLSEDMIEEVGEAALAAAPDPTAAPETQRPSRVSKPPPAPPPTRDTIQNRSKEWHETLFDEDYLRTLPYLTPQATRLEAEFVLTSLEVEPGSQVLDLGCGYGRHAMELAAKGLHVVGLDASLPLLLRGADEAQRRHLNIHFVHGDMRELAFEDQFDGGYCLFSTFGFFDDDKNIKVLEGIHRSLKPGAKFVLQVLNRDYLITDLPSRVWWEGDGCVVLEEVEFNYFSSRVVSSRSVVFDDSRQLEQEISLRVYSLHELGRLLHNVGFRITDISGSMLTRGRFLGNFSRELVVTIERSAE